MAMEWKDYSQTKPNNEGWCFVWLNVWPYTGQGCADIDYWDGAKWKFTSSSVTWWFEIEPPPSNSKQEEQ